MTTNTPAAVRAAFVTWLVAVGAGAFETVLVVASGEAGDGAAVGVAVRLTVFVAAVLVALRMRAGRRWARLALTVGLGVLGTLSLVLGPIGWLLDGNSLPDLVSSASALDLTFGASRVVHVCAVLAGCVLMFVPSANAWFRSRARARVAVG
ncbi:hypothetical protein [Asanoa siamensis]|uniref:Uncharacterized protein n=1 Tax=Asanoa siamensis TaxID=926357 RepID=A0ABQ4CJ14_9ACTN|nr:hypothetical protein [Asanoa siamensis]GIF71290.1 hypothetical protein Asi02nite_08080 [Asanoa siamensis]